LVKPITGCLLKENIAILVTGDTGLRSMPQVALEGRLSTNVNT
jgi:hypothetical protein